MRVALRLFVVHLMLASLLYGEWWENKEIRLHKDETVEIMVNGEGSQRLLSFRWTLYHNDRLVLFKAFDGIVSQHVLALNHFNQSFRVGLTTVPKKLKMPFILVKFTSFDHETKQAVFKLLMRDDDEIYVLKYLNEEVENE